MKKGKKIIDEEVDFWLPCKPIYEKNFPVYILYVDPKLTIFVIEANDKESFDYICETLKRKHDENQLVRKNCIEWQKGNVCFAWNSEDECYHRAEIQQVNIAKYQCEVNNNVY